jgi:hypothetical protein
MNSTNGLARTLKQPRQTFTSSLYRLSEINRQSRISHLAHKAALALPQAVQRASDLQLDQPNS